MRTRPIRSSLKFLMFSFCMGLPVLFSVGGGQGIEKNSDLAELVVSRIWNTLDLEINHCFHPANPCFLHPQELSALKTLQDHYHLRGRLEFSTTAERWKGGLITLNRQKLYSDNKPISYNQLAQTVIVALLSQLGHDELLASTLAQKIIDTWQTQEHTIVDFHRNIAVNFQWIQLEHGIAKIFLKIPAQAYDLSSLMSERTPCDKIKSSLIQQADIKNLFHSGFILFGKVLWHCQDDSIYTADFNLYIPLETKNDEILTQVKNIQMHYTNIRNKKML